MEFKDLWLKTINELAKDIPRTNIITLFKNTAITSFSDGVVIIGLPNAFYLQYHVEHYEKKTLEAIKKVEPLICSIKYEVDANLSDDDPRTFNILKHFPEKNKARKLPNKQEVRVAGVISKMLNSRFSLDNFVVAPENRLAHAAAQTVAKHPGENYNPLFIYGGVGLGKTHLLQSIGREVLKNDPQSVVVYTTTESFTNEVVDGIQSRNMNKFRNKYRKVDVFIIDDIQFIANKDRTEEEFFHTFNSLHDAGKQIVISSDRPPQELTLLSERLVSRFESGMIVDVKMPDYESRLAIIRSHCQEKQAFINDKVLEFIAFNVDTSVRALIGVVNQAVGQYELEKTSPTIKSVSEIVKLIKKDVKMIGFVSEDTAVPTRAVTIEYLTDHVSDYFAVPKSEVLGDSRARDCLMPRQVIMYLAKTKLRLSLARIGQHLGNRNHTTVMHGIEKLKSQIKNDRQLMCDVNAISKEVGIH